LLFFFKAVVAVLEHYFCSIASSRQKPKMRKQGWHNEYYADAEAQWTMSESDFDRRRAEFMMAKREFEQKKDQFLRDKEVFMRQFESPRNMTTVYGTNAMPTTAPQAMPYYYSERPERPPRHHEKSKRRPARETSAPPQDTLDNLPEYFSQMLRPHVNRAIVTRQESSSLTSSSAYSSASEQEVTRRMYAENPIKNHRTMQERSKTQLTRSSFAPLPKGETEFSPIRPNQLDMAIAPVLTTRQQQQPQTQAPPMMTARTSSTPNPQATSVRTYMSSDRPLNFRDNGARAPEPGGPEPTLAQAGEHNKHRSHRHSKSSRKQKSSKKTARCPELDLSGILDYKIRVGLIRSQQLFYHPQVLDDMGRMLGGENWSIWEHAGFVTVGDVFEGGNKLRYDTIFAAFPPAKEKEAVRQLDIICAAIPLEWREDLWRGDKH
jgi:hypothetical protein